MVADRCVKVWDIRSPEPVSSLEPADGQNARCVHSISGRLRCCAFCHLKEYIQMCARTRRGCFCPVVQMLTYVAHRDCWSVAFGNSFNDDERCVVAGYDNGDLKVLDLRMNKLIWEVNVKNGVRFLVLSGNPTAMHYHSTRTMWTHRCRTIRYRLLVSSSTARISK